MSHTQDLTTARMAIHSIAPQYYRAMAGVEAVPLGIEAALHELLKVRISQVNGCGYCIDAHSREALAAGEDLQRIMLLDAWRESPQFTERERAALALAESITLVSEGHVPDEVYEEAAEVFEQSELAEIIWRTAMMNVWNRIAISTRMVPGSYRLRTPKATPS